MSYLLQTCVSLVVTVCRSDIWWLASYITTFISILIPSLKLKCNHYIVKVYF